MTSEKLNSVPAEAGQLEATAVENVQINSTQESLPAGEPVAEHPVAEGAAEDVTTPEPESLTFAEEEAQLAAESDDFRLDNDEMEQDEVQVQEVANDKIATTLSALANMTKSEVVAYFGQLLEEKPVQSMRYDVEAVKVAFYKLHRADVEAARKRFIDEGGVAEEFQPEVDADELKLKEFFAVYRSRRAEYMASQEEQKEENLRIKQQIIEQLKELINSNETMNHTFQAFRELQQRWKDTGVVPQANVKEIWETYNLHVENFYNYIKINKELRDLDLKRNYEAKVALCEEAEALSIEPSVLKAFAKLQELHEQWREIGPVATEHKEAIWERFKASSSRINKAHQEYYEGIKAEQKRNLDLKTELCVKAEELSEQVLTTRKEWNRASDKLIEIQKVWKTIGFAPKKENTKIYERFRAACDRFFELKRGFYEAIKSEMENNLQLKLEICEAAESLKDSEQWKKSTDELIGLQKRWKEIGPVSRRQSDAVWKRFRAACDHFFARKAEHFAGVDAEQGENLSKKMSLLEQIESFQLSDGGLEAIKDFQRRWSEIGHVPFKEKDKLQKRYKAAIDRLFEQLRSGDRERSAERYRNKIQAIKAGGGKLRSERERLYNRVKQLESDIATLENNIGFFAHSKGAEALIRDVQNKIERAKQDMADTIEKINLIDSQSE